MTVDEIRRCNEESLAAYNEAKLFHEQRNNPSILDQSWEYLLNKKIEYLLNRIDILEKRK